MNPRAIRRIVTRASPLLLTAAIVACGKSASLTQPTPPAVVAPPPPVVTVVSQGGGSLPVEFLARVPLNTTATGTLDVTVDWTFGEDEIWVYLVRGSCSFEQFEADQCNMALMSETKTPKPRRLSLTGAAGGAYTLFVGNLGPRDESLSYQVTLTTGGASAAAARSTEGASTAPGRSALRWRGERLLGR